MSPHKSLLRHIPGVDRLLQSPLLQNLASEIPTTLITDAARNVTATLRERILAGELHTAPSVEEICVQTHREALLRARPSLRPVLNATGTLLHTNLGRAPLSDAALSAMESVARSYSNLELDLESGERGHRYSHIEALLCRLTGAEAATVVNNNAGAVMLALTALAQGREAIVSRGELVEIGGAFRVPDVMAAGGVLLHEIGTTNKTHLRDYRAAINEKTGLLLKVHTSNYRIVGFTAAVSASEMVSLAREHNLPVLEDLGSGMLMDLSPFGLPKEPTVAEAVGAGIDVVTFSGDKLLGGPQAGLIVGRKNAVEKIRKHPFARALRSDKLTLAALEATLRHYLDPADALREIPVLRMLAVTPQELRRSCRRLQRRLSQLAEQLHCEIVPEPSAVGGGALPLTELPGEALALRPQTISVDTLATRLRLGSPAVVGRRRDGLFIINPRTLRQDEEATLCAAIASALTLEATSAS